jgi:outer membrane protein assembly factor BamB
MITLALLLLAAAPLQDPKPNEVYASWTFNPDEVEGDEVSDLRKKNPLRLEGGARVSAAAGPGALMFSSPAHRAVIDAGVSSSALPKKTFSAETWVTIDQPLQWGAIITAMQDNGGFEKGWLLGYVNDKFCLGLSTEGADDGDGFMSYIAGKTSFKSGEWYHVVATYDGKLTRIYVNGALDVESELQSGAINYPSNLYFEVGAYRDDNESYPMTGWVSELTLWRKALTEERVRSLYEAGVDAHPSLDVVSSDSRTPAQASWIFDDKLAAESAHLDGGASLHAEMIPACARFDGSTGRALLSPGAQGLPSAALTIESYIYAEESAGAGCIASAFDQHEGRDSGWVLGWQDGRFRFGLSSEDNPGPLTWVTSSASIQHHRWYHVVGSYDGKTQRLFVDGKEVGAVRGELGPIRNPITALAAAGWWQDDAGEHFSSLRVQELQLYDRAMYAPEAAGRHAAKLPLFPTELKLSSGPSVRYLSPTEARVSWSTKTATPSIIEATAAGRPMSSARSLTPKTEHQLTLTGLGLEVPYHFLISGVADDGRPTQTQTWSLDTAFNYELTPRATGASTYPDDERGRALATFAEEILAETPRDRGWALVLEAGDGRLAYELAMRSDLKIVCIESSSKLMREARAHLKGTGLYGSRITMHKGKRKNLAYGDYFANLIVAAGAPFDEGPRGADGEVRRLLTPNGGVAFLRKDEGQGLDVLHRAALEGAGSWTTQYGNAANTSSSNDELVNGAMTIAWFGRPGPRPMRDRGARNPAPLSSGGIMYVQGDDRIFGMDAYNGSILWTVEVPNLIRTNVKSDSTNMVCDDKNLYAAVGDSCWIIEGGSGDILHKHSIPTPKKQHFGDAQRVWGYLALVDGALIGSITRNEAIFRGRSGEWYDGGGWEFEQVLGEELFRMDPQTGETLWRHAEGVVIHSSIAISEGELYFAEDRAPSQVSLNKGRLVDRNGTDQHLVSLDLFDGTKKWEKKQDLRPYSNCLYTTVEDGVLVLTGSKGGYKLEAFNTDNGTRIWNQDFGWAKDHHGGKVQHPVVFGGMVFAEERVFDLKSGEALQIPIPTRRGCGTMSASANNLFFRDHNHGMYDPLTQERHDWAALRGGCWLNMIPAGGLLLTPEASSGCSCNNPIQTTAAFRPVSTLGKK